MDYFGVVGYADIIGFCFASDYCEIRNKGDYVLRLYGEICHSI
jgi:hypothetical protein